MKETMDKLNNRKEENTETVAPRILVIDDEEIIRNLLTDVLSDAGHEVIALASPEEAMEKVKEMPFEVVITDLKMPGMDGIEVLRKIKKVDSDISVIVVTGYSTVETAVDAMREGAYDYINKPFNAEEIKIVVSKAIERRVLVKGVREKEYYKELSITDGLTQLYNHRYFYELLTREIVRAKRYPQSISLLMIDIDNFKIYNDAHGHLAGDKVLRKVATVLRGAVRAADFVARYGGEEFGIILPETDKKGASVSARCLRKVIEETKFDGEEVLPQGYLTISIGVATYPEDAKSREELIQKADEAMYESKHQGKNTVCFFNREFNDRREG